MGEVLDPFVAELVVREGELGREGVVGECAEDLVLGGSGQRGLRCTAQGSVLW